MKLPDQMLLVSALALASAVPVAAQVEKVAMHTTGISCGVCAAVSEISFKRIPGVDKVSISLSQEAIMLSYKPGATFDPQGIRKVLQPLEVGVVQFQISARGRVQERDGKRFFVAGKDRFVLSQVANAPAIPSDTPILIEGILNDHVHPMEVKILNFKTIDR
jgi:copper chaperone CopZ